jgi:hypothetical protein
MANAPLPTTIPGSFFVLEWDRPYERYVLHLDDEEGSSHNLGSNIPEIMMRFRIWGLERLTDRMMGMAREFGAVQVIPDEDKVAAVISRDLNTLRVKFRDDEEATNVALPKLR